MKLFSRLFLAVMIPGTFLWGGRLLAQESLPILKTDSLPKSGKSHLPEIDRPSSLSLPKSLPLHKFEVPQGRHITTRLSKFNDLDLSKDLMGTNVLGHRLTLSGTAYEGINTRLQWQNNMLYSIQRGLQVDYKLGRQLSLELSGMIGHTSLPSTFYTHKQYDIYGGLRYDVNDRLTLGGGMSVGGFVGTQYLAPNLYAHYTPSDNWRFGLYGGVNLIHSPTTRGYGYQSLYSGMTFSYTADRGIFIYGRGFMSRTDMPDLGWAPHPNLWTMGAGGGVGYNIPGYGPVSMGVDYVYNPITKRMEPVYSLNIVNGLIFLIEQLIQGLQ